MAIDVLSAADTMPIVVGDEADMINLVAIDPPTLSRPASLLLRDEDGGVARLELSAVASVNFGGLEYVTIVALAPDDQISFAMLLPCGNKGAGRRLEEQEVKIIAERLVSEDFDLFCLC